MSTNTTSMTRVVPFNFVEESGKESSVNPPPPPLPPPPKKLTKSCCCNKKCLKCFFKKPKYGGLYILLDMFLIVAVMVLMYDDFYVEKHAQIQTIAREVGQNGINEINNAASFYHWLSESMLPDILSSMSNTKNEHLMSTPGFQIMYDSPVMVTSLELYQDRRDKPSLCSKKISLLKNKNVLNTLLFLGIDCSDKQADEYPYGYIINKNDTIVKECPYNFSSAFASDSIDQKPFSKQNFQRTDPINVNRKITVERYYINFGGLPSNEYVTNLRHCGWIDTRTRTIQVKTQLLIPTHAAFGTMNTMFYFNEFGGITNIKRSVDIVCDMKTFLLFYQYISLFFSPILMVYFSIFFLVVFLGTNIMEYTSICVL
jgi:hypothetical protein